MKNSFRLRSDTMYSRPEEGTEKPKRIVVLSVEGNKTEQDYLKHIHNYRTQLGIQSVVHILPLQRSKNDNLSAPEDVLELLNEYIELRDASGLPERMRKVIPEIYSDEFIKSYLESKPVDVILKRDFELLLESTGIDLKYNDFLKKYKGENDIFGIVIDKDAKSHTVDQLNNIVQECVEKNYKCFITNPCIEFWLLLHLVNIKEEYPTEFENFLLNDKVSTSHTFTSKKVSDIAHHSKGLSEKTFKEFYLPKVDFAISQAKTEFCTDLYELIGNNQNTSGKLGSNLTELFEILREI